MFNKVGAVVLFVQDFATCLAFYRDKLGLQVVVQEPTFAAFKMEEQDFALQDITAAADMFQARTPHSGDGMMLCADFENVDAAYETFKTNGVEFTTPLLDQSWGIRAAYFRDPDGNLWEIRQRMS